MAGEKKASKGQMQVSMEKGMLVIRIPAQKPAPSASGKTLIVASTRGNKTTDVIIDGKPLIVGMTAYVYAG